MNILISAHSGLRYVAIILLITAIIKAFSRWKGRKTYTPANKRLYMFAMVLLHIQLVLGLVLYFAGPRVEAAGLVEGFMANDSARFWMVEHLTGMVIGLGLITFGYSKSKRLSDDEKRHRLVALTYTFGTLIILYSIPWPFRDLGTGWI